MEHINNTTLPNGYVRLTAKDGYRLINKITWMAVSEAVVKPNEVKNFTTERI